MALRTRMKGTIRKRNMVWRVFLRGAFMAEAKHRARKPKKKNRRFI
jgi:hypothetical protein